MWLLPAYTTALIISAIGETLRLACVRSVCGTAQGGASGPGLNFINDSLSDDPPSVATGIFLE